MTDTDTFVATVAPLSDDPAFQAFLVSEMVGVVQEQVDLEALTTDVCDELAGLNLPPRAQNALALLEGPAIEGVRSLIRSTAERRESPSASRWPSRPPASRSAGSSSSTPCHRNT
ncbi:MAG: hypothetical protein LH624_12635 [Cryobacterium sp.]|nr:hypothetical protein [Cryobacterium sp.]